MPDYRIGPLDKLNIVVFGEEDLGGEIPVGLSGKVAVPLIGEVPAQGRTTAELAADIARLLNERYLRDASVSVSVLETKNLNFTVDGEVKKPGIYDMPGRITLMQAVALGEGTTEFAKLNEVVIFRSFEGKRYAARFDLNDIRAARFTDPEIRQGDVVVVGYSGAKRIYRDILTALPGLAGLFVALRQ
ncbi:polysaccharide biosynthesis/export family protein [Sphingomonas sp. DT-207]|uniref:polysaccharide biosynthesis/export family protein n=1 Tax=Sphingomonas sp. DT-207 TaxID=3396167 RepID=UPI003F1DC57F